LGKFEITKPIINPSAVLFDHIAAEVNLLVPALAPVRPLEVLRYEFALVPDANSQSDLPHVVSFPQ
jgi:hypothetical protein